MHHSFSFFGIWHKKFFQKRKNHFWEFHSIAGAAAVPPTRPESIKWNSLMFSLMLCSVPTPGTEQLGFYPIQIEEKMEDNIFLFFTSFFYFRSETALPPNIQLYPLVII
jgi:hypothetical protein